MERLENPRKVQKLPSEAFLSDLKKLGRIDKKFKTIMVEAKLIEKFWETARTDLRAAIATLPEKYTLSVEKHFGRNAVIIGGVKNGGIGGFEVEGKEYSFVWTEENYDYNGLFPFEIHGEWHSTTGKVKGTFTYMCEDLADGCFNYTSLAIEPEEFDKENNPKFYQGLLDECENIQGEYDFFTPE